MFKLDNLKADIIDKNYIDALQYKDSQIKLLEQKEFFNNLIHWTFEIETIGANGENQKVGIYLYNSQNSKRKDIFKSTVKGLHLSLKFNKTDIYDLVIKQKLLNDNYKKIIKEIEEENKEYRKQIKRLK